MRGARAWGARRAGVINTEEDIAKYTVAAIGDPRAVNKSLHIRPPLNTLTQHDLARPQAQRGQAPRAALRQALRTSRIVRTSMHGRWCCRGDACWRGPRRALARVDARACCLHGCPAGLPLMELQVGRDGRLPC